MSRTLQLVLLTGLSIAQTLGEENGKTTRNSSLWASPALEGLSAHLGEIALDGSWNKRLPVDPGKELEEWGLSFELRHKLILGAGAVPRSVWVLNGLESSLVPGGREHLVWQPPGLRTAIRFELSRIGRAFDRAGTRQWLIREKVSGVFEIRSVEGLVWTYRRGQLVSIDHPFAGRLDVEANGAHILSLRDRAEATAEPLITVNRNAGGRVESIVSSGGKTHFFEWTGEGALVEWRRSDGSHVTFGYRDGLIHSVSEGEEAVVGLGWRQHPDWERGDRKWPTPWHLADDGRRTYRYDFSSRGFRIVVVDRRDQTVHTTLFNPRRGRIIQGSGAERREFVFEKAGNGLGRLLSVSDGEGRALETYRYDGAGNLIEIVRADGLIQQFTYDESGRLKEAKGN